MLRKSLIGFGDFEMGATPAPTSTPRPTVGPPPARAPLGQPTVIQQGTARPGMKYVKKRPYGSIKQTKVVQQHGKVMSKARQTLLKAARGIGRAQMILAQKPASASAVQKATASAAARTAAVKAAAATSAAATSAAVQAHPDASMAQKASAAHTAAVTRGTAAQAILGAVAVAVQNKHAVAPAVTAKMTPKAKAAVEKHNKALAAAKQANQKLAQQTLKTRASVKELAKAAVNQKKVSKAIRTKGGAKTHVGALMDHPAIGAEVAEALLGYYEAVGADPDPSKPGFLTDGSPDPAFATTSTDTSAPLLDTSDVASLADDPNDPLTAIEAGASLGPPPPPDAFIQDYNQVGGILYDGSKGKPNGFVGSYGLMTRATSSDAPGGPVAGSDPGVNDYGVVWGSFDQDNVPNGTPWGGRLAENQWNEIYGRYVRGMPGKFNWPIADSDAFQSPHKVAPNNAMYGPLIGNPGMPDFKGMRVDAGGNMFWLPQEAPDWLTFPLKQAAALTAAKEAKAAADEQKQFAAEEEKKRRDEQAQQAAQDAANALAESQATSASNVAQQEEAAKQAQQETAAEQQLVEAAQQQTQQDAAEAQQEQQANQLLIEQAQRQQALLAQNPDIELALMAQDALAQGGDVEEGDEGADDTGVSYDTGDTTFDDGSGDYGDAGGDLFSEGGDEYSEG